MLELVLVEAGQRLILRLKAISSRSQTTITAANRSGAPPLAVPDAIAGVVPGSPQDGQLFAQPA
jgi:hypothetical protein